MTEHKKIENAVMIVCRSERDAYLLARIRSQQNSRYIVASDDIRVHDSVQKCAWVDEVCWLERKESFYNVADDVLKYREIVNEWLSRVDDGEYGTSGELYSWIRNCEGGMTSQRIQDLLHLIRSYTHLIDSHGITKIVLIARPGMAWEDAVLSAVAESRKVEIQTVGRCRFGNWIQRVWLHCNTYLRALYYTGTLVYIKLRHFVPSKMIESSEREVVFQLCGNTHKHVDNIAPLMDALRGKGYNPIALCWSAYDRNVKRRGAVQIRERGHRADELEGMLPLSSIVAIPYRIIGMWRRILLEKQGLLKRSSLSYDSVPLGRLLWPSIKHFVIAELIFRQLIYSAAKKYFKYHKPMAIKLWGNGELVEGMIVAEVLKNRNVPVFSYFIGMCLSNPYARKDLDDHIDLFLATGAIEKSVVIDDYQIEPDKVVLAGKCRYDHIRKPCTSTNKKQSLSRLGIDRKYKYHIFYDPGSVLRGYCSPAEYVQLTRSVLAFAKANPEIALIIKPHPSGGTALLDDIVRQYSFDNVYVVNRRDLPDDALRASDIVITKMSTIAIEAMLMKKGVISVILDGELRFRVYGSAVEYIETTEALHEMLSRIFRDEKTFSEWLDVRIEKQEEYCREYFVKSDEGYDVIAAEAIHGKICEKSRVVDELCYANKGNL